jgi:hypothetical protein
MWERRPRRDWAAAELMRPPIGPGAGLLRVVIKFWQLNRQFRDTAFFGFA